MSPDSDGSEDSHPEPNPESPCCKVQRTASAYGIDGAVDELEPRRRDGDSFRDLAAYFNTQVVDSALSRAGLGDGRSLHAALTGGDIASDVYEVLRTDRDSDIRRAEVRARLSDAGIDVDELESAFVSHVTVRSHLQECVEVTPDRSPPPFEQIVNTTQGARTRALNVIESTVNRAVRNGQLETGELETDILVQITCQDCGETFYLTELLDQRQCSCPNPSDSDSE